MMYKLYGDGIHDDTDALQELIDSSHSILSLPDPENFYLISRTLTLPSNFKLKLPRYAEIRLMKGSDCYMLTNKDEGGSKNIELEGGIWNYNNLEQSPNPWLGFMGYPTQSPKNPHYNGFAIYFNNVKNLRISSLTVKDVITFAITLDIVSYFTVDNIVFDFNLGNPLATNMDGVHLCGNCHFGHISNIQGACYDDLIAINADEGSCGPITHVTVDGLYAEDCHSAVRLLSRTCPVKHIHITNVHGTFFQYCIGITHHTDMPDKGDYEGITLDNIYASKAPIIPAYNKWDAPGALTFPIIYIEDRLRIRTLKIADLRRIEHTIPIPTISIGEKTEIDGLILDNIVTENHTDEEKLKLARSYAIIGIPHPEKSIGGDMPFLVNNGSIKNLYTRALFSDGEEVKIEL